MKYIHESRASAIIHNLLLAQADLRPWLLPANICPIVPITFLKAHVPFEFVDISTSTLHMDLEQVEDRIKTRKFGGLLYAHTYGEPSTPRDFFFSLKNIAPDLYILDDRCLCVPGFESDAPVDLTLYSTGQAKIVELGYGGYALAQDHIDYLPVKLPFDPQDYVKLELSYKEAVQARKAFVYRDSSWLETTHPISEWRDYREEIENRFEPSLAHRNELNAIYRELLPFEIQLPPAYQMWRFNIRVKNKVNILQAIFRAGLFASSHYASLAGIMAEGYAPRAEILSNEIVNLFNDHHFDLQMAEKTCKVILENYEG